MAKRLTLAMLLLAASPTCALGEETKKELNPWVDCGFGAIAFDDTSWAAVSVNVSWDFGATAITSNESSQNSCSSKKAQTARYIDVNRQKLARDMSVGGGEVLDSLAHLLGVETRDRPAFGRIAKHNMPRIFPSDDVTAERIAAALRQALAADAQLARYTAAL